LLVGGRGALRRDGALLRHRLRRRATRRIPRGRWRGRLSRWRRRRRRSLRGCRAGCHQSCQDQKKRLSLHGEKMLPCHRCSILAEKTDWRIRPTGPQDSFSVVSVFSDADHLVPRANQVWHGAPQIESCDVYADGRT
jgi:hypothetical protein